MIENEAKKYFYIDKRASDCIKGGAIVGIMLSHFPRVLPQLSSISSILHPLGYLGVALFLTLSGYGCSASVFNQGKAGYSFLLKRLKKIIPPLFICIVIAGIIQYVFFHKSYSILDIFLNAAGLSCTIGRVTWYITFQYVCYIVLMLIGTRKNIKTVISYMMVSVGILLASIFIECEMIGLSMWGLNAFSFEIGVLWRIYEEEIGKRIIILGRKGVMRMLVSLTFLFCILFIFCYLILDNPQTPFIQKPLKSLIAAVLCITALLVCVSLSQENTLLNSKWLLPLRRMGKISYELFLIHGIIIYQFPEFFISNPMKRFIVYIVMTSVLSILLRHLCSRVNKEKLL